MHQRDNTLKVVRCSSLGKKKSLFVYVLKMSFLYPLNLLAGVAMKMQPYL